MLDFATVAKSQPSPTDDRRIRPMLAVRGSFARRQTQVKETFEHLNSNLVLLKTPTKIGVSKTSHVHNHNTAKLATTGIQGTSQQRRANLQRSPPKQSREIFASILLP